MSLNEANHDEKDILLNNFTFTPNNYRFHDQKLKIDFHNLIVKKVLGKEKIKELEHSEDLKSKESFFDKRKLIRINSDLEKHKKLQMLRPMSSSIGVRSLIKDKKEAYELQSRLKSLKMSLINSRKLQKEKEKLKRKLELEEKASREKNYYS